MIVFQVTPGKLWALWKERDRLDYRAEDYEDEDDDGFYEPISAPRKEEPAPRRRPKEKPQRSEIDIPLDGELEERGGSPGRPEGLLQAPGEDGPPTRP